MLSATFQTRENLVIESLTAQDNGHAQRNVYIVRSSDGRPAAFLVVGYDFEGEHDGLYVRLVDVDTGFQTFVVKNLLNPAELLKSGALTITSERARFVPYRFDQSSDGSGHFDLAFMFRGDVRPIPTRGGKSA
jgi:hypothetical protein